MKAFSVIAKIIGALVLIAGAVYVVATYGDKIVAWAKSILPCKCCKGEAEETTEEAAEEARQAAEALQAEKERKEQEKIRKAQEKEEERKRKEKERKFKNSIVGKVANSAVNTIGREVGRSLIRGIMGSLKLR